MGFFKPSMFNQSIFSMDECEALCNRIGFMNKGTLISIGSSQHLKSRYSTTYMLTITQATPSVFSSRFLNSLITRKFNVSFFWIWLNFVRLFKQTTRKDWRWKPYILEIQSHWFRLPTLPIRRQLRLNIGKSQKEKKRGVRCSVRSNKSVTSIHTQPICQKVANFRWSSTSVSPNLRLNKCFWDLPKSHTKKHLHQPEQRLTFSLEAVGTFWIEPHKTCFCWMF